MKEVGFSFARRVSLLLLVAGSFAVVGSASIEGSRNALASEELRGIRGADGKKFQDGSPQGCEAGNTTGEQVTSSGCNASNTFPFTAATCITCRNPSTQNQPVKDMGPGDGTIQMTASCGKKRVGMCENGEEWPMVTANAIKPSPNRPAKYLCNDSGSLGEGDCSTATQTTQQ